jgi:hypothetical protein|tara:strand:+ start:312 stop:575 length:264 start_codon:yes stop_codon:yes gene_type:complete
MEVSMKKLTNLEATLIAEGAQEPETEEQYIQAWQHLIDTGLAWKMQGFFGRTASAMIQSGVCSLPIKKQPKKPKSTGGQTPRTPQGE